MLKKLEVTQLLLNPLLDDNSGLDVDSGSISGDFDQRKKRLNNKLASETTIVSNETLENETNPETNDLNEVSTGTID